MANVNIFNEWYVRRFFLARADVNVRSGKFARDCFQTARWVYLRHFVLRSTAPMKQGKVVRMSIREASTLYFAAFCRLSAFVSFARAITYARINSASRCDSSFLNETIPFAWSKPPKTISNHWSFASAAEYRRSGSTPPLTATSPWQPEQNR